ncbi:MAG TPA: hypothetical protein VMP01_15230 [Pirellulaceae bacterium]|nr:hypothetical protein [Pirellulaceae bacterium]
MTLRLCSLSAAAVLALSAAAYALPPIPGYVKNSVEESADHKEFAKTFSELKTKCDLCHKPMADKKAKGHGLNDYGEAMHKHLKHKEFMALHNEKKSAEAMKLFKDAWEKAAAEKNADGQTFGELIKAGKLPGKNS